MEKQVKPHKDTPTVPVSHLTSKDSRCGSKNYHLPKINKTKSLREKLDDVEHYEVETLSDFKELSLQSREIVSQKISAKLNVRLSEPIYHELPKLIEIPKQQQPSKRVSYNPENYSNPSEKLRAKEIEFAENVLKHMKSSSEISDIETVPLPGEDEFLGILKLDTSKILVTSTKADKRRFLDTIEAKVSDMIYKEYSNCDFDY